MDRRAFLVGLAGAGLAWRSARADGFTGALGGGAGPAPFWAARHDGIVREGVSIPSQGLKNGTLRRALKVATEPHGRRTTMSGRAVVCGRVSWFGGPDDDGVTATETGALTGEVLRRLHVPMHPSEAQLAARPADFYFAAMRFDYDPKGAQFWRDARLLVLNGDGTRAVVVRCVDWGPHTDTRRIIDLGPQVLRDLGVSTDDEVLVAFARAGSPLGRVRP